MGYIFRKYVIYLLAKLLGLLNLYGRDMVASRTKTWGVGLICKILRNNGLYVTGRIGRGANEGLILEANHDYFYFSRWGGVRVVRGGSLFASGRGSLGEGSILGLTGAGCAKLSRLGNDGGAVLRIAMDGRVSGSAGEPSLGLFARVKSGGQECPLHTYTPTACGLVASNCRSTYCRMPPLA